ncbi:fatty acid desaturase family protein [Archangium lansingense]|uniref:Fatty acid desaturase family protein n=1 Tax=Archangium lansingense TaxID=2995310 RepID=A0ABT4A0E8_9BACT|nr:fatty acid desaturase family protein [Archangium lansinium]MCY1074764.1 fatty acid desaturase family protein [Archangium lansinium]
MSTPTSTQARPSQWQEKLGVVLFFVLCALLARRVVQAAGSQTVVMIAVSGVLGFVTADLVSGLVHWLFDTWFSRTTPVLGKTFVTPFRVHHEDPLDITRHGFVATNGHNCLVSVPVLALALLLPSGPEAPLASSALTFVLMLCLGVFGTNQFHKWSHAPHVSPVVAWLQARGIILGREHHDVHHTAPHTRHYCITTGWLNRPLEAIGFFGHLETLITAVTRQQPRAEELNLPPAPAAPESAPAPDLATP